MTEPIIVTTASEFEALITRALEKHLTVPTGPPAEPVEIIDTKTLCARLNITEPTIVRLRKRREIPFLIIGESIRYDWYEVLKSTKIVRK